MHERTHIEETFSNREGAAACASSLVDRVGEEYRVPPEILTDLRIALDEVITNIVSYAYADDRSHDISIRCELRDGRLETTIEDDGRAYDPLHAPEPDLDAPLETRRVGGLGMHFVKNLMNAARYERVDGRNRLTLSQHLPKGKP